MKIIMRKRRSGIYVIRNTINDRYYVGSTVDKRTRWAYHRWCLRRNKHPNPHLQSAWNLYGEDNFEFVWVQDVPEDQLLDVEQGWLDTNENGYNIAKSAYAFALGVKWPEERKRRLSATKTGKKHTEETKAKISAYWKGRKRKPRTAEHCRRLSETMKGKKNGLGYKHTEEALQKMREVNLGNKHWLGKTHSEETKRKIGDANRGRVRSEEQRKLLSQVQTGRKHSAETRAKRSASLKAYYERQRALVEAVA